MSATVNGEFHLYETWVVTGTVRDYQSQPIDLDGSVVALRVAHANGSIALDLSTPATGTVTNSSVGEYEFVISPDQQLDANVSAGVLRYEVKASLSNGRSTVQNTGQIRVVPSLFQADSP